MVRDKLGPIACFKNATCVKRLPKTRSGKILRKTIRSMTNNEENIKIPATIEDITVLDEINNILKNYIVK